MRRWPSPGAWAVEMFVRLVIAAAFSIPFRWLSPTDAAIGGPVWTVFVVLLSVVWDGVFAVVVAYTPPSIANRLRGYTPPCEGGPRG